MQQKKYLSLFSLIQPEYGFFSRISNTNRIRLKFADDEVDHYSGIFPIIAQTNHRYAVYSVCHPFDWVIL